MNIVIFGAGTVGTSIARTLCANHQNVVLVDKSRDALDEVEEQLDVQTVYGSACDANVLFQAGVQSSDLCLSVTSQDEVNLLASSIARSMGAARSVARIFDPRYRDYSTFDYRRHFGVDRLLSLEHLTALELAKNIRQEGLFAVENFARGGVEVHEVAVEQRSSAIGIPLKDLKIPTGVRIGVITHGDRTVIAGATDVVSAGDHVAVIGSGDQIESVKRMLEHRQPPRLNVLIAGGGEIGFHLARLLQGGRFNVVLMEENRERSMYLAERLQQTTVLHADATRRSEMEEARVGSVDVFIASTGRDEDNIVCGVEARELGARRIMNVVRRPDYANVLEKLGIDVSVSPREVLARQVLGMVDAGPILDRSWIASGQAEVWEVEVNEGAHVTSAPLKDLQLSQCLIAAIDRADYVRVPGADDQLQPGDVAIVLVQSESVDETLRLFDSRKQH